MIAYDTYLHDEDQTCVEPEWEFASVKFTASEFSALFADIELEELKGSK